MAIRQEVFHDKFMGLVKIETYIHAPIERCFDLARSMSLHARSAKATNEKIVRSSNNLLSLGDVVTFEARHFGVTQRLSAKVVEYNPPHRFRDSQVAGIFKSFHHDHLFETRGEFTVMTDSFLFVCPLGQLGRLADFFVGKHLEKFLKARAAELKAVAESDEWMQYL